MVGVSVVTVTEGGAKIGGKTHSVGRDVVGITGDKVVIEAVGDLVGATDGTGVGATPLD